MNTSIDFKNFCESKGINIVKGDDGKAGFQTKTVTSTAPGHEGEKVTYHILAGVTAESGKKILFIPSLQAWRDHESGKRGLAACEVVVPENGATAKDGTPILYLHCPTSFAGTTDLGF